jgi:alpha-tubulin suppressor-like RCC1 family protein
MRTTHAQRRWTHGLAACVAMTTLVGSLVADVPAAVAEDVPADLLSAGGNGDGQLGTGTKAARAVPGPTKLKNIVRIASGRASAYAVDAQGTLWAWGDNAKGQLGDGTFIDRPSPVKVMVNVDEFFAGDDHVVALSNEQIYVWGAGGLGQLGLGTKTNRNKPTLLPMNEVSGIGAGGNSSYALVAGTLRAWGENTNGELGDGTLINRSTPVAVYGTTNFDAVVAGRNHAFGVRADNTIWAWGANQYGQLGDGTTIRRTKAVQVLTGVRQVLAGTDHSLALQTDGTVLAWGRGQHGQLGLGATTNRSLPQAVPGLTGIVSLSANYDQSFARNAAGDVWAWGYNNAGQLGDGTKVQRTAPTKLTTVSKVSAVAAGQAMTFFLPGVGSAPPPPDTSPPTVPTNVSATSTVVGRADITWSGSTDDRTTPTYQIFRDDGASPIGQATEGFGSFTFSDIGLEPGSVHTYRVAAFDGVNLSALSAASPPVTVATMPPPSNQVLYATEFTDGLTDWYELDGLTVDAGRGSPSDAPPSARAVATNTTSSGQIPYSEAFRTNDGCASADVRVTSVGAGSAKYALMKLRTFVGSSIARVQVDSSMRLSVRSDIAGSTLPGTFPISANTWTRIALCVATGGPDGTLQLRVNGETVGTWTVNTGAGEFSRVQLGDNDPRTATVNWDHLVVTAGLG